MPNEAPYKIVKSGDKFQVLNNAGVVKSSFPTEQAARQYQKALYANVPGAASTAKNKPWTGKEPIKASALAKIVRLAGGPSTTLAIQGNDDQRTPPVSGLGPALASTTAASIIPGMVVSHPALAGGKPFQVLNHAHRGTHVEIIGKHAANGRGVLGRLPPNANLMVHSLANDSLSNFQHAPMTPSISNGTMPGNQQWSGPALGSATV